ncbi:helix-turn-helix domain-containing protein [Amycolatopsis sp. NPDC088138]|uniref:helix-turn-helix domain-containing protein n=1 Tax=Amycolatopsis sp. NPDC088138 TaxID=3363938 RepID=UPI003826C38D
MTDPLTVRLAATVHAARTSRGLSSAALAENSGVSRAMIGKIERGDVQPTAALLAKLSSALGLTLSELIARAEGDERRVVRAAEQPVWVDPDSGYRRRSLSPASGRPLELVEIELPAGAEVPLLASTFLHQQIWVLDGRLRMREGAEVHELDVGDCLVLGSARDRVFANPGSLPCRYLVALVPRAT